MAFRSVRMRLFNMTNSSLTKIADHLEHGIFTDPFSPPPTIMPDQLAQWRGESGGDIPVLGSIGTGTEGSVDYRVVGPGDIVHFYWDNPAVGNTFFEFKTTSATGGPSPFVFFALNFAYRGDIETPPGPLNPPFAVSQGDEGPGPEGPGTGVILPFPGQEHIKPHAWFDIGLRNSRENVDMRRWLKALGVDPSRDLRAIFGRGFDWRKLIELPIDH